MYCIMRIVLFYQYDPEVKFVKKPSGKTVYLAVTIIGIIAVAVAGLIWWNFRADRVTDLPPVSPTVPPADNSSEATPPTETAIPEETPLATSVARQLEIPWALDFLPDGSIILTERPGRIRLLDTQQGLLPEPLLTINEVVHRGESGLLGIAVHPAFSDNGFVYIYYTYQDGENLANKVVRFRLDGNKLSGETVIIDSLPAATIHNGGRLKFGTDGYLYITTGDAANPDSAQNRESLAGKILRVNDDGTIPADNPFPGSPVYSFGHRNPQGLAWDNQGRLWETEHGSSATDELNLIEPGGNYGWPVIRENETAAGMISPVIQSGGDTWAPSGMAYLDGSLYFAGLRGQSLYRVVTDGESARLERHLNGNFGRLRDVVTGPDSMLYILTSNYDGRGFATADDDQIIRINPGSLD